MPDTRPAKDAFMQTSRRNVLKGAVGAALAAGLAPQTMAAASTSVGGLSAPQESPAQLTVGTNYGLQLGGGSYGSILAAAGGDSYADVIQTMTTGSFKGIGRLNYETITLGVGPFAPRAFYTAIGTALTNSQKPQSGAIASQAPVSGVLKTVGILQMTNAYLSQINFPLLGAEPGAPFNVIYAPTSTTEAAVVNISPSTKSSLTWSSSNFQLQINGILIEASGVDSWQAKIPIARSSQTGELLASPAVYGDLVFRIAANAKSVSMLRDWYKNTALAGKTIYYDAVITVRDPGNAKAIIQLNLSKIGIYRLRSVDLGVLEATCFVNGATVTYPSGQLGIV